MARVSKELLSEKERRALVKQYTALMVGKTSLQQEQLLSELLTDTEQVIVLKRVAAVILLDQKYSLYEIARTLKLSTSTIAGYKDNLDSGRYTKLLEMVRGKEFDVQQFWKTVDKVLRLGLPPIAGPGRWSGAASAAVRGSRSRR